MMPSAKRALYGFRQDSFWLAFSIIGQDLTGGTFHFAVRQYPGAAGDALFAVTNTGTPGAEGLRLAGVEEDEDGVPISYIELIVAKEKMQALPAASPPLAEAGEPVKLYYDMEISAPADAETPWTDNVAQTWIFGDFIVRGNAVV